MFVPNRVAFALFGFPIYWYGIIIAAAALLGILIALNGAKKCGIKQDDIVDVALLVIPLSIICARLYYVAFTWETYSDNFWRIFAFREGGMAIYGGVIGGALALLAASKWKKISLLSLVDVCAPALVLGQAIGRWGNFVNQEAFGGAVTDAALQWFPFAVYIQPGGYFPEGWYLATFFYESLACFLIFGFLMIYTRKPRREGSVALWYFLLYGLERAFVEGLRTDSLMWGPVRVSQALSIVLAVASAAVLVIWRLQTPRGEKAEELDDSLRIVLKNDEPELAVEEIVIGDEPDGPEAAFDGRITEEALSKAAPADSDKEEEDE